MRALAGATTTIGCFFYVLFFVVYGWLAYVSVDFITNYFGKDLPWIVDLLIGIISISVSIWVAIVLWLLG